MLVVIRKESKIISCLYRIGIFWLISLESSPALNRCTQLLNCQWYSSDIDHCQVLNINHQNHKHTYSHDLYDQNDRSNRFNTLYDCDD